MSSIFSKIIARDVPAHIVYEDDRCIAILDKFPAIKGQSLVIPKEEIDYAFNIDSDLYAHLFLVAKRVAKALDAAFDTERTCLVVEGFEVPHMHIKLYPMQKGNKDLAACIHGGAEASDEELRIVATQIQAALEDETE